MAGDEINIEIKTERSIGSAGDFGWKLEGNWCHAREGS